MRLRTIDIFAAFAVVFILVGSATASPITVYDETVQGDFAGLFSAPTLVTLATGQSEIIGATGAGSPGDVRDYFTFTIPNGAALTSLTLASSSLGTGLFAFIGIERGPAFTFDPTTAAAHIGDLLGYTHFSPANNGQNLLPLIGTGLNAIGFTGPLGPGQYSVWIQDTSAGVSNYDFVAEVVPEPATMLLMLTGIGALKGVRRRRR